ncbi:hypothetical protein LDJ79_05495 [Vibrio tritonius]|uniref:Uncharacterized protein n=1 Tax=Vibrio tritonius TaxID=1435069 RepID=A0ABS7YIQ4_9VIBR|nr:hypothetical protein [Vibrio tritonius]MCA2015557.1 hypothetical protein [Vibrio tritonius]
MKIKSLFGKRRLGSAVMAVLLLMGATWAQLSSAQSQIYPSFKAASVNQQVQAVHFKQKYISLYQPVTDMNGLERFTCLHSDNQESMSSTPQSNF